VSAAPAGRVTLDSTGNRVGYVISPTRLVYLNAPASRPRLVIVER
jgi:hypothetical protein